MKKVRVFKPPFSKVPNSQQAWRGPASRFSRLVIEIGAGVGFHAVCYAKSNSDSFIIPIEKTSAKFNKLNSRVSNHPELDNIYPVHANAINWIFSNLDSYEVDECFILYPNPYPKASQQNKRFTDIPFMDFLFTTLKPGASLTLATNMNYYYEEAKTAFMAQKCLELKEDFIINNVGNFVPRTHFEKKYLERNEVCYNLVFVKI